MSTASKDTSSVALLDKLTPLFSLDEDVIPSKMIYLNIPSALTYPLLLYVSAKSAYDHLLEPFRRSDTVLPIKNVVRVDVLSATNTLLTLPSFAPPSELLAREEHAFPQTVNCLLVAIIPPRSSLLGNSTRGGRSPAPRDEICPWCLPHVDRMHRNRRTSPQIRGNSNEARRLSGRTLS